MRNLSKISKNNNNISEKREKRQILCDKKIILTKGKIFTIKKRKKKNDEISFTSGSELKVDPHFIFLLLISLIFQLKTRRRFTK